ncbi:MAG: TRAP transporter permease, partial [Alphaproteobacteria bacterium]|nr:TRAP transporter permease [Alphaproteobacteria bacterium]
MSADQNGTAGETGEPAPNQTAEDLVAQVESGPRNPTSRIAVGVIIAISVAWSVYQLYIAQNPINSFIARSWHLGFALALVFLAYPAYDFHNPPRWVRGLRAILPFLKNARPNREYIPLIDIVLAIVATAGALFIWWDFEGIITRQGLPSQVDVWMGVITLVLLLEAARRALGPALSIICMV